MDRRTHTSLAARRITALVLAVLFVLQSAAQAGSGCVSRVLAGHCCCVASGATAEPNVAAKANLAAKHETVLRSCCAERAVHRPDAARGSHVTDQGDCRCRLGPAPITPADKGSSAVCERLRGQRGTDVTVATWIALGSTPAVVSRTAFDHPLFLGPPGPPPRTSASFAATRLAQRGVIGLLSELCTDRS
jgi:hypothetical protein